MNEKVDDAESKKYCGIIMPISALDDCLEKHWIDVRLILTEAISASGYTARLVSDADDSGIIQKRIVQNIYDDEIIVCDVSGRNPNVMFELGMRLAFDKPTIIVMDDKTNYAFDTSIIEHLQYPRSLDYFAKLDFKKKLKDKILATIKSSKDPNYSTFLKQFGNFKIAKIADKEVSIDQALLSKLDEVNLRLSVMNKNMPREIRRQIMEMKDFEIDKNEVKEYYFNISDPNDTELRKFVVKKRRDSDDNDESILIDKPIMI